MNKITRIILGVVSSAIALNTLYLSFTMYDSIGDKVKSLILALVFLGVGYYLLIYSNSKKAKVTAKLNHVNGLPIAEKTLCKLIVSPNKLSIQGGGVNFDVDISKINAAEVKTDVEIANIVHSSAIKGVTGGLLFGPIGLVVGARPTNKEKRSNRYYLIINYTNASGEIAPIVFDSSKRAEPAKRISNQLKRLLKGTQKVTVQL